MTQVANGSSSSVTLLPGDKISTFGDAIYTIGLTGQPINLSGNGSIGPFGVSQVVSITATASSFSYRVTPFINQFPMSRVLSGAIASAQLSRTFIAPQGAETVVQAAFATFTYMMIVQVDAPFDAVRPILFNVATNDIPGVAVCAAAGGNYVGDKTGNTLAWVDATFSGSATGTQLTGAAQRPTVLVPDMIPLACVPRTDGGSGFLAYVRVVVPTGGTLSASLSSNTNYLQLNDSPSGMLYANRAPGNFVTTNKTTYNPGATRGESPIFGFEFISRGQIVSIIDFGDSITRGQGSQAIKSQNMFQVAAIASTLTKSNIPITNANCGWSSQDTSQFFARMSDLLSIVKPTMAVYAPFSPNEDRDTGTLTQAMVDGMRYRTSQFIEICRNYRIVPVIWTGLPAAKGWNATSDNRRKAYNAEILSLYGHVALIADFDSILSNGDSPAAIISGVSDGTHPFDTGNQLLAYEFQEKVLSRVLNAIS